MREKSWRAALNCSEVVLLLTGLLLVAVEEMVLGTLLTGLPFIPMEESMLLFLLLVVLLLIDELVVLLLLLSVTLLGGTAVGVEVRNIILDCLALLAWSRSCLSSHPSNT
jgi:hypothetical protein